MRDPEWIYGFSLLGCWFAIIMTFGHGTVVKETSFGLQECIIALSFLSGQWANKKFGGSKP